jgi:hypothetical protein
MKWNQGGEPFPPDYDQKKDLPVVAVDVVYIKRIAFISKELLFGC